MLVFSANIQRPPVRVARALAAVVASAMLGGCGDDGLGTRYPVSGSVTYKGEPVASASITFYPAGAPTGDQRGATGVVDGGWYTLSTAGGDDGAFPGDYVVSLTARNPDLTEAQSNIEGKGGSMRQDDVAKAFKNAKGAIPLKYESPESGGLTAKVEAKSNKINFELQD